MSIHKVAREHTKVAGSNSLVALGLLLARILHLRRVSAFGKDADGIQFLPQA